MPEDFHINNTVIRPGEQKKVVFSQCELPSQSNIEIPAYVFRSVAPGPTILLSAGMNGEETNGIETIRQLIKRPDIQQPLCGSIILVPVFNVVSFIFNQRDLPDGRDLNRCFPGTKGGSLGSRLAYDIMHTILPLVDFGIDFHTGGARINNYPQLRFSFDEMQHLEIAKLFEPPFVVNAPYREGSFRMEAAKLGKSILVFEAGESLRFNTIAISEGINGCLRMLKKLKMIATETVQASTIIIGKDKWMRAQEAGLFRTHKKFGTFFNKGEVIGTISDPYNKNEVQLLAPDEGYIIGINNQPVVHVGDALLHIGMQ